MAAIGTRSLTVSISGTEYFSQVSVAEIQSAEADGGFFTFADAAAGGARDYILAMTLVQDAATGSLWDRIWSSPGTSVPCIYRPYGNAAASVTQPHYTFNAIVKEPDGTFLGGEADPSATNKFTVEVEWPLVARPVKVTA